MCYSLAFILNRLLYFFGQGDVLLFIFFDEWSGKLWDLLQGKVQIGFKRPSDNVILRREPKNLEGVSI